MKTILKVLALSFIGITSVYADDTKEMYVPLEPQIQLVISNAECKKWKATQNVQLNYAYAVNLANGEQITGCWTHKNNSIIIELTDDLKNFYSYKINADHFLIRPAL
jgi:hypothetical protein